MATFKAQEQRLVREHNERAWLAWHIEALHRGKRLPKLERLLAKSSQRTRQSWQEQMNIMSMWSAAMRKFNAQSKPASK